jgi:hypothetical protein
MPLTGEAIAMTNGSFLKPLVAAAALALAVAATPASAQRSDDMRGGGQNPCVGDAQKLCNEFIPDRGKVASCLFKNKPKLTPACRAELGGGGKQTASKKRHSGHRKYYRKHRR